VGAVPQKCHKFCDCVRQGYIINAKCAPFLVDGWVTVSTSTIDVSSHHHCRSCEDACPSADKFTCDRNRPDLNIATPAPEGTGPQVVGFVANTGTREIVSLGFLIAIIAVLKPC
jgi:hypothetical protein